MPIGDLLAQITGEPNPTQSTHNMLLPPKRKLDDQLRKTVEKVQKSRLPEANSLRPLNQNASAVDSSMSKMKLASNNGSPAPNTPATSFKNGQPTPPLSDIPKPPPKKGSFAEIMARGKAAQANVVQIGKIQHKRIEKLPGKREREESKSQKARKLQRNLAPNSKFQKSSQVPIREELNGVKEKNRKGSTEPVVEKKVKKAAFATTGYAGTARPKPGSAKASSRPSGSSSSSCFAGGSDKYLNEGRATSSRRYAYVSEEEDVEEAEEYESDVSSDMEAAAFEVDEEEEMASRIARREDAEALAEENRLKREKEEKRRRLASLAKSRR